MLSRRSTRSRRNGVTRTGSCPRPDNRTCQIRPLARPHFTINAILLLVQGIFVCVFLITLTASLSPVGICVFRRLCDRFTIYQAPTQGKFRKHALKMRVKISIQRDERQAAIVNEFFKRFVARCKSSSLLSWGAQCHVPIRACIWYYMDTCGA